jgi:hypothetical protein
MCVNKVIIIGVIEEIWILAVHGSSHAPFLFLCEREDPGV